MRFYSFEIRRFYFLLVYGILPTNAFPLVLPNWARTNRGNEPLTPFSSVVVTPHVDVQLFY